MAKDCLTPLVRKFCRKQINEGKDGSQAKKVEEAKSKPLESLELRAGGEPMQQE